MNPTKSLSKSAFLSGLQCQKLLWKRFHAQEEIPEPGASQQAIFDQGRELGRMARLLFPGGREIEAKFPEEVEAASRLALMERRPLFEAVFRFEGCFARADILVPVEDGQWDLLEVKGVTDLKPFHVMDVAFQAFVLAGAGISLRRCFLVHVNRSYVREGAIEPGRLFTRRDCTPEVSEICRTLEEKIGEMQTTIGKNPCPDIQIGPHCDNPYSCPLKDQCWGFLPEHNVMNLYRGKAKGFDLLGLEVTQMKDIPAGYALTANQRIQVKSVRSGKPRVSKPALRRFLADLEYPVHYVDFETFSTAIPLFDGLRPFQRVPFQFSLHIQQSPDTELDHYSFLADGRGDPRREFMERLRESIDDTGSIVTYNAAFEKGVLKECVDAMPEFQSWVESLEGRIVDLLQPFRGFRYYHPSQRGSASMKSVLPALTGDGYENLAIQDGDTASREYLRVTFGDASTAERDRVRKDLETYCGLDTEGMWQIVSALGKLVGE